MDLEMEGVRNLRIQRLGLRLSKGRDRNPKAWCDRLIWPTRFRALNLCIWFPACVGTPTPPAPPRHKIWEWKKNGWVVSIFNRREKTSSFWITVFNFYLAEERGKRLWGCLKRSVWRSPPEQNSITMQEKWEASNSA